MTATATAGWPFLIARGRRRGYRVLLAPGWLIDECDYGFLEEAVSPLGGAAPYRTATATSARGQRLALVWAEHLVTTADLAAGSAAPPESTTPRDEHSRPLRLLYGFLCADTTVDDPSRDDLARSRQAALGAYRRFLADEDHFTVESSTPFDLVSAPAPQPPPPLPAVTRQPTRRPAVPVLLGLLAASLTAVGAIWFATSSGDTPPPGCPPPPTSSSSTPTPTAATTTPPAAATPLPSSGC